MCEPGLKDSANTNCHVHYWFSPGHPTPTYLVTTWKRILGFGSIYAETLSAQHTVGYKVLIISLKPTKVSIPDH